MLHGLVSNWLLQVSTLWNVCSFGDVVSPDKSWYDEMSNSWSPDGVPDQQTHHVVFSTLLFSANLWPGLSLCTWLQACDLLVIWCADSWGLVLPRLMLALF